MIKKLTETEVIAINTYLIKRYSPQEMVGVKDARALNMCIESIDATAFGEQLYPTVMDKAAILFINLVKKHCFHNANKRTAFTTMVAFLSLNGVKVSFDTDEGIDLAVKTAAWPNSDFNELKEHVVSQIQNKTE